MISTNEKPGFIFSTLLLIWLLSFYVLALDIDLAILEIVYEIRRVLVAPILVMILVFFLNRLRPTHNKPILILLLLFFCNLVSLLTGAINPALFVILCGAYVFGLINVFHFKHVATSLILLLVFGIVIGLIDGEILRSYFDGRSRLIFGFNSPTLLATICSISIFLIDGKKWWKKIVCFALAVILFYTGTRSALYGTAIIYLAGYFLWEKHGSPKPWLFKLAPLAHAVLFLSLLYLIYGPVSFETADIFNNLLSGRLSIWTNASQSVGLWGGIDPGLDWLRGGIETESAIGNRASMDGYYVLRWMESGLLFLPEYLLVGYMVFRAASVTPKAHMQIILVIYFIGFVESVGIGFGSIPSLLFTSLLIHNGLMGRRTINPTIQVPKIKLLSGFSGTHARP